MEVKKEINIRTQCKALYTHGLKDIVNIKKNFYVYHQSQ